MNTRLMERWIESGSEIARLSAEGTTTYWTGRRGPRRRAVGRVRRRPPLVDRGEPPRAPAMALAATRSCSSAPSPACATSRRARRPTWCRRWSCRRRPATTPASSTYSPTQSQMKVIQRRRAGARVLARVDRRHPRDQRRRDRGLPGLHRALDRAHRRPGQPDRRLPGRLAGRDLRGAAPRGRQYADARGRADRLPRRRRRDPRLGRGARQRRPRVLPLGRRAGRRRAQGRAHAQRLHPDQAGERGRQAGAAADAPARRRAPRAPPPLRDVVQARAGHPGHVLPLDRRAPVHGQTPRGGHAGDRRRARRPRAHRLPAVPARRRARPHHAARAGLRRGRPRRHQGRRTSRSTSTRAGTSASSWAPRRCASTGPRSSPPSTSARVGTPTPRPRSRGRASQTPRKRPAIPAP